MKREELLCSMESLKYRSSWRELACSAFVMLVTTVFVFFFASDSSGLVDATWTGRVVSAVWHRGGECVRDCLGVSSMRLLLQVLGCVFAGFSSAVVFVFIRFMTFGQLRVLRLIEYYRMRYRLFYWTLCIVFSLSLSQFFIDVFVPVTFQTVLVSMTSLVFFLGILYLQTRRSIFLVMAYALLGVFSALSVAGFVVMLGATAFYAIETANFERHCAFMSMSGGGYGYGSQYANTYASYGASYGKYGGGYASYAYSDDTSTEDRRNLNLSFNAVFAERLRLTLVFAYFWGFVLAVTIFFSGGVVLGFDLRDVSCDWLKCYVAEFESTVTLLMIALSCVVIIAGIFILNKFNLMLTEEYYLKTSDVLRLLFGALLGCLVFIGIGRPFNLFKIDLQRGNMLVPLVIQVVTALEILMPAVVFITSLRCRKYNDMNLNLDEGPVIHRSNWLTFFLLLIFDIVPVALPVISTFYLWRGLI